LQRGTDSGSGKSRFSAALIVRDEARFIEGCLQSLVGKADEIVVVDTGSVDDTIEKALQFPTRLYHFAWNNDFSAARNFALEQATGEWILYIDADERFDVPDPELLESILADASKVAWNLRFHPRIDWTPYAEPRLFRNDPRIRFRGVIHESMREGIEHVRLADGREVGTCGLTLHHIGYEDDQSYKNSRNIPLLQARLAREPEHLYSLWHLGRSLHLAGDEEGAIAAWTRGIAVARARPPEARRLDDSLSALALIKLKSQRGEAVEDLLREALELYPSQLALLWINATRALERGDLEAARPRLEELAAIDADTFFDPQIAYEKILFRYLAKEALALCHFRAGRYAEAARFYRLAAQAHPDPSACEIKARLAELRAVTNRSAQPGIRTTCRRTR
jgi:tetratricopeptide (TPR) repeat protein